MASTLTNPKHVEQVRTLSKKLWDMADVVVGHGVSYTDFWVAGRKSYGRKFCEACAGAGTKTS